MLNPRNGLRNFLAAPPRGGYFWNNVRAVRRRDCIPIWEAVSYQLKVKYCPWSRDTGWKRYVFDYRSTMLAQNRGIAWRRLNTGVARGWDSEFPCGNRPFEDWLKVTFWYPLPRPWRYLLACDCWKYADSPDADRDHPEAAEFHPCGGNRSANGCLYL